MAEEQPTQKDLSTEDLWDLNRKLTYANEQADSRGITYDQRVENLNQKIVADAQGQAMFGLESQERQQVLKLNSVELAERMQALKERQDQHSLAIQRDQALIQHAATLANIDYSQARNLKAIEYRTIEPTREEVIQDGTAAAVSQAVDVITRAMSDRTQTSASNVSELSAARQVTDTNVLNTLSELAGITNVMQSQSASTQAAFQALTNQVAELTGVVQALQAAK
jgi:hypothetical protein